MEMFLQLVTAVAAIIGAVFAVRTFYAQRRALFPVPARKEDGFFVLSNPAPYAVTLREIRTLRGALGERRGRNVDGVPRYHTIGESFSANRILPAHSVSNIDFVVLIDEKRYTCDATVKRRTDHEFDLLFTPLEEQELDNVNSKQDNIGFAKGGIKAHAYRFPR